MVGRDRELARVTGLLDDALAGRGRLVLCTGEAGIGKTRLGEEVAAAAEARGVPVAWARASDQGSSPPYGLWRLVLSEPAVDTGSVADLWPGIFGAADLGAESSVAQRFALFAEVRGRLAAAASGSGLVLVLDDLQWADEASAALLVEVVRQLRGTRILVFATYRDSAADGILARLSAEVNTERVDLRGLPAGAVGDLLLAGGLAASPEQARRVHDETGGNPFLVRELGQSLIRPDGSSVPGRVVEATAYRLTQLSDEAQAVLRAAAVAGNSFSAGVVAKMLDRPVLSLLGPLEECAGAGFLVAGDRAGDQRFSHALVSSAVVARLSATQQRRRTRSRRCTKGSCVCTWPRWPGTGSRRRCPVTGRGRWRRARPLLAWRRTRWRSRRPCACTGRPCPPVRGNSARTTGPGSSWPWPRRCTAAATCRDRSR
jgi:hypothetical protein